MSGRIKNRKLADVLESAEHPYIKVGIFDLDGVLRGKYLAREKVRSCLEGGLAFCDVVLGWDMNDQLYDNVSFTGWHTGYPDASVRLIPESLRFLDFEGGTPFVLGEFTGPAAEICPRSVLQRVLGRAAEMGLQVKAGVEYEFFVFEETPRTVREKHFRDLLPLGEGYFGYSVIRSSVHADFYRSLLDQMAGLDIPIEGLHEETGAGVMEAAIGVDGALAAADKAALFKTFAKIVAQQQDRMMTFMAKCSNDWPGQSGHVHLSLVDKAGTPVFHETGKEHNISDRMRHFIGGQQRLMPEFLALVAPTVNSYRRLVPDFWAPTSASWGVENRTCALRAIPGRAKSQRVEYRVAGADANPYLALAAAIASGLWGMEHEIEPTAAVAGNAYDQDHAAPGALPASLEQAARALNKSPVAREWFGDAFVDHFTASREWEVREFRKHVTDWELDRYFEII